MARGDHASVNEVEVERLEASPTGRQLELGDHGQDSSGGWAQGSFEFRKEALDRQLSRSQITGKSLLSLNPTALRSPH